ncbi:MAG: PAS domain-containing protein [Rhizobiales bacterium]|nr:PAS domain-containing protein [Hyphomicrobiales bacterium]
MNADAVTGLDANAPFESAGPAVVKSIKQRDLLNTWLRLYARDERLPKFEDYQPERLADELPDIVYCSIEHAEPESRIMIDSDGTRMSNAYGTRGKGRYLDEYLGPKLAPIVMPIYRESILRRLPVYTISKVDDLYGRKVDYERLLMPFSDGAGVNRIVASLKTISDDGGFEIRNLMRANDVLPIYVYKSVIDQKLFHKMPGRIAPGDTIEFS